MSKNLLEEIIKDEGFSSKPYIDILVKKDPESVGIPKDEFDIIEKHFDKLKVTFGYGSTYITEKGAEATTRDILSQKIDELLQAKPIIMRLPQEKQLALFNMNYQLGTNGLLKFKRMWEALEAFDYKKAGIEARDSKWHSQTPQRAEKLARILEA